jgi:hypothetical protein
MKDNLKVKLVINSLRDIKLETEKLSDYSHEKVQISSICEYTLKVLNDETDFTKGI